MNKIGTATSIYQRLAYCALAAIGSCDPVTEGPQANELVWQMARSESSLVAATPIIADGHLYIDEGSQLLKIDIASEEIVWQSPLGSSNLLKGHIYADGSSVYVYEFSRSIKSFDKSSGILEWQFSLTGEESGEFSSLIDLGADFAVPLAEKVIRVNKANGQTELITNFPRSDSDDSRQISRFGWNGQDGEFCVTTKYPAPRGDFPDVNAGGIVYYINQNSNEIIWIYDIPEISESGITFHQEGNSCVIVGNMVVVVASGRMSGLNVDSGELVWDRIFDVPLSDDRDGFAASPASTDGDLVFVGSTAGQTLYALDHESGEIVWATKTRGAFTAQQPIVSGEQIYITNSGQVWVINRRNGVVIAEIKPALEEDAFLSWPAVSDGYFAMKGFNSFYVFKK